MTCKQVREHEELKEAHANLQAKHSALVNQANAVVYMHSVYMKKLDLPEHWSITRLAELINVKDE